MLKDQFKVQYKPTSSSIIDEAHQELQSSTVPMILFIIGETLPGVHSLIFLCLAASRWTAAHDLWGSTEPAPNGALCGVTFREASYTELTLTAATSLDRLAACSTRQRWQQHCMTSCLNASRLIHLRCWSTPNILDPGIYASKLWNSGAALWDVLLLWPGAVKMPDTWCNAKNPYLAKFPSCL